MSEPRDSYATVDIEITNRCNADCYFCPRDQTPHEGLMTWATYEKALERTVEYRSQLLEAGKEGIKINLCGLGESLINKITVDAVRRAREEEFFVGLASNGALLDERRGDALLEAGLGNIHINVSEQGDAYEEIYKLPWERTRDNVTRFIADAEGTCDVYIVLVDHRREPAHLVEMEQFWRDRGARRFVRYDIINRGGSLFVDHMQYHQLPQYDEAKAILDRVGNSPMCITPFMSVFIGYDGKYYLCCSDWKKELSFDTVHDRSILSITHEKLAAVDSREPVCRTCNLDPTNLMVDALQARDAGEMTDEQCAAFAESMGPSSKLMRDAIEDLDPAFTTPPAGLARRKLIPVVPT